MGRLVSGFYNIHKQEDIALKLVEQRMQQVLESVESGEAEIGFVMLELFGLRILIDCGAANGGIGENTIPDACSIRMGIRFPNAAVGGETGCFRAGGLSDSGITVAYGVPTVCGMGARGEGKPHPP